MEPAVRLFGHLLAGSDGDLWHRRLRDGDALRLLVGSACRQFTGGAVGFARFGDLGMRAWLRAKWLVGDYAVVAALFGVTMLCTYAIINSPIGLAFRAIKDNPGYAVARGVNRFGAQLLVFGLSAFFTGLAGGLYAAHFQAISPGILSLSQLLFIIAATVVLMPQGLLGRFKDLRGWASGRRRAMTPTATART